MTERKEGPRRDRHTGEVCPRCHEKTAMHTKKQYNHNHPLGVRECSGCRLVWAPRIEFMGKLWLVVLASVVMFVIWGIVEPSVWGNAFGVTYMLSLPFVVVALLVLQILNPPVYRDKSN